MAHREDTCWGKAKYRVVVTQILATRVEAFGLPAAADWHVTPPPLLHRPASWWEL